MTLHAELAISFPSLSMLLYCLVVRCLFGFIGFPNELFRPRVSSVATYYLHNSLKLGMANVSFHTPKWGIGTLSTKRLGGLKYIFYFCRK